MRAAERVVFSLGIGLCVATIVAGAIQSLRVDRKLPSIDLFAHGGWIYINDLVAHNDVDGAIEQLEMRKRMQPLDADTYEQLGNLLARRNRLLEARINYEELVRLRPDHARGFHLLGSAFLDTNQLTLAARQFGRAIQLDSKSAPAYNGMGVVLARLGRLDEAERYFAKAVELAPEDEGAMINLKRAREQR